MKLFARAGRRAEFAVGKNVVGGDKVDTAQELDESAKGDALRGARPLHFKIAEHADSEVVFVVTFHVRALVDKRSALPDPAGAINDKMVGDVGPAALVRLSAAVESADVLHHFFGVPPTVVVPGLAETGVVDRDEADAVHEIDAGAIGSLIGPVGARNDDDRAILGGCQRQAVGAREKFFAEIGNGRGGGGGLRRGCRCGL